MEVTGNHILLYSIEALIFLETSGRLRLGLMYFSVWSDRTEPPHMGCHGAVAATIATAGLRKSNQF